MQTVPSLPQRRTRHRSTNPLECLHRAVERRADVVCISALQASIIHHIGAVLRQADDK